MKQLNTLKEVNDIDGSNPSIIKFGQPNCIPCKMTQENLENIEKIKNNVLTFYECSDINVITNLGFNSVPVIMLITPQRKLTLTDTSIMMDEEDLLDWINNNIGD